MNIKDSYLHGDTPVVKSISVNADKLTYTLADKTESTKTITLPLATTSANGLLSAVDKSKLAKLNSAYFNDIVTYKIYPQDNGGRSTYMLIAELPKWVDGSTDTYYFVGRLVSARGGNKQNTGVFNIVAIATSYAGNPWNLDHTLYVDTYSTGHVLEPYIVSYNDKNYLALKKTGSSTFIYFEGIVNKILPQNEWIELNVEANETLPSGMTIVRSPNYSNRYSITTCKYFDGTFNRTLLHDGNLNFTTSDKNYAVNLSNNNLYVSVPWTDTKNTAGSTNSTSKLYLIGAAEQSDNPQTYSNSKVFVTNGVLTANAITTAGLKSPNGNSDIYNMINPHQNALTYGQYLSSAFEDETGIAVSGNANGVLWVGTHGPEASSTSTIGYGHMLGFIGGDGALYHKTVVNGNTTRAWKQIAYTSSDITGNAATADKLKTTRKLWGQDFDGSSNVSGSLTEVTSISMNGDIVINDGYNNDRYIKFQFNNTDTYAWRLGYTGSKSSVDNDFVIQTTGSDGSNTTFSNVLQMKPNTKEAIFSTSVTANSFIGNLDGTYVNKLTGYAKATAASNIAATDTLNTALGKLEYKADWACDWITSVTADDTDTLVNKWGEIVDFLDSVTEGTDITDEFVTRKTNQTITGTKTFNSTGGTYIRTANYGLRLIGSGEYGYLQLGQIQGDGTKVHMGKITGIYGESLSSLEIKSSAVTATGNITANRFTKAGGTSSQFLKADGSVDDNTYATEITWDCPTTVGTWSRICSISKYSSIILSIIFSQTNQASLHTYLISSGYDSANITQIGYNNYGHHFDAEIRITKNTNTSYYIEVLNKYGNTTLLLGCKAIIIDSRSDLSPIETYTEGSGTVMSELVSAKDKAVNFNADLLDGKHASDFVTSVKVGSTSYSPSSGVVSLPAYPTSLKSPNAIKFKNAYETEVSYDGSAAVDLTSGVNYAAKSSRLTPTEPNNVNDCYEDKKLRYFILSGCAATTSTDGKRYAGTANSYGFPVSNNANAMMWVGSHSGNYGHQLGFSSDGRIYNRYISNGSFATTVNGGSWKKIAFTSDIPTKVSQLINDSGYLTSRGYIGTTAVQETSTAQNLTGIDNLTMTGNLTISAVNNDRYISFNSYDGVAYCWRIGYLGSGYDDSNYLTFESNQSTGTFVKALQISNVNLTSTFGGNILPATNNAKNLGSSSLKWANVYATTFTGNLTGNVTGNAATATTLKSTTVISAKTFNLINTTWTDTGYTFANLATGTYVVQVTSGTDLVASGIMSVYKNLEDTAGDEIPLHVYHKPSSGDPWRPYLRTYQNKLQISSNDNEVKDRTVTIKIAQIL